jgi:hypothetical protein
MQIQEKSKQQKEVAKRLGSKINKLMLVLMNNFLKVILIIPTLNT